MIPNFRNVANAKIVKSNNVNYPAGEAGFMRLKFRNAVR